MKRKTAVIVAAIIIALFSCAEIELTSSLKKDNEPSDTLITKYVIPSGAHYAQQSGYRQLSTDMIRFRAKFDSSAVYRTIEENNQGDINKLYGMSDCGNTHQINSARFGWRWYGNKLEIWAYTYVNGQRKYTFVDTVALNTYDTYEIVFNDNAYIFKLHDVVIEMPRHCTKEANGYRLYPYFGGDEAAPHEITIHIEDIQ